MNRSLHMAVLLVLACLFTLSCQTYVNIPAQKGSAASHNPNGKTVRKVMMFALQAAITDSGMEGPVQIMLPEGSEEVTYHYVADSLGSTAVQPDDETTPVEGIVFAKAVRIRGTEAEVDIIRPAGEGLDQLITVYLTWKPVGGWYVDSIRVWRGVPIDD